MEDFCKIEFSWNQDSDSQTNLSDITLYSIETSNSYLSDTNLHSTPFNINGNSIDSKSTDSALSELSFAKSTKSSVNNQSDVNNHSNPDSSKIVKSGIFFFSNLYSGSTSSKKKCQGLLENSISDENAKIHETKSSLNDNTAGITNGISDAQSAASDSEKKESSENSKSKTSLKCLNKLSDSTIVCNIHCKTPKYLLDAVDIICDARHVEIHELAEDFSDAGKQGIYITTVKGIKFSEPQVENEGEHCASLIQYTLRQPANGCSLRFVGMPHADTFWLHSVYITLVPNEVHHISKPKSVSFDMQQVRDMLSEMKVDLSDNAQSLMNSIEMVQDTKRAQSGNKTMEIIESLSGLKSLLGTSLDKDKNQVDSFLKSFNSSNGLKEKSTTADVVTDSTKSAKIFENRSVNNDETIPVNNSEISFQNSHLTNLLTVLSQGLENTERKVLSLVEDAEKRILNANKNAIEESEKRISAKLELIEELIRKKN